MVDISKAIAVLYPLARSLQDFRVENNGSGEAIAYWDSNILGTQPSQATLNTVTQAQVDTAHTARLRALANALVSLDLLEHGKAFRAVLLILLDELNLHALKINAILDAVDGATTLGNLKSAVAVIADYPQRTKQNLLTALTNKLNAGAADN